MLTSRSSYRDAVVSNIAANPFIPISDSARLLIIIYFVFWRILPTMFGLVAPTSPGTGYVVGLVIAAAAIEVLLLLPFLLRSFAGSVLGWLHPLILPTLVNIGLQIIRFPQHLFAPIMFSAEDYRDAGHVLLFGWPVERVLAAQLELNLLTALGVLCTYAGFSIARGLAVPWKGRPRVEFSVVRYTLLFGFFLCVVFYFLQRQGGIIAHMSVLGGGRFRMREMSGPFLVVNAFLPYMLVLWYLYRPSSSRNPIFWAAFVLMCVLQFVIMGSRSALFTPITVMLAAWMFINRRLPATRVLLLSLSVFMLLGVLGEIRRSGREGEVDFTALRQFDSGHAIQATQAEVARRNRETALAVVALVPEAHDHLWGTTYVAAMAFFVPRVIWPDKPRGAGAHAAALLYGGRETMDGYAGGGYPPGATAEAYWNFGILGVVAVFSLFGAFLRFASDRVERNPANPVVVMFILLVLFRLGSPATIHIVDMLQSATLLLLTLVVIEKRFRG